MQRSTVRLNVESLECRLTPAVALPTAPAAAAALVASPTNNVTYAIQNLHFNAHGGEPVMGQVKASAAVIKDIEVTLYWSKTGANSVPVMTRSFHVNATRPADNLGFHFDNREIPSDMLKSGHLFVVVHVNGQTVSGQVN